MSSSQPLDPTLELPGSIEPTIEVSRELRGLATHAVSGELNPLDRTAPPVLPSSRGERYGVPSRIGAGGMGEVLMVEDRDLGRNVVMKRMLDAEPGSDQLRRFISEARITAQLEHPSIVPVHELSLEERPFFTMKLVHGETLASLMGRLRKDPEQSRAWTRFRRLQLLRTLCNALAFAHSKGVLHRDLKPANVMVGEFGEVQVMDWGLARVMSRDSGVVAQPAGANAAELTSAGAVVGTPGYMSPEQARGEPLDARSDVYALGVLMLELLTTRVAFARGPVAVMLVNSAEGKYQPLGSDPDDPALPPELTAIIETALASDRERRYRDVRALIADLDAYLDGRAVSVLRDSPWRALVKWVGRNKAIAAGIAALGLGLAGADAWQQVRRGQALMSHVQQARQALAGGDRLGALELLDQAEARAPGHADVLRLKRQIVDQRVAELRARHEAAGEEPGSASESARHAWLGEQSAVLHEATVLAGASGEVAPRRLEGEVARAMSRQLARDGDLALAAVMLDVAAAAGLEQASVAGERTMQREALQAERSATRDRIRALLDQLANIGATTPARPRARRLLSELAALPDELVRDEVCARGLGDIELMLQALIGCAGDGSARVRLRLERHWPSAEAAAPAARSTWEVGRWLAHQLQRRLAARLKLTDQRPVELRADELIALHVSWLTFRLSPESSGRLLRALERFETPAIDAARAVIAWKLGPSSDDWSRQQRRGREPAVSGIDPLEQALILHAAGDREGAAEAYQRAPRGATATIGLSWLALEANDVASARQRAAELPAEARRARLRLQAWAATREHTLDPGGDHAARALALVGELGDAAGGSWEVRCDQSAMLRLLGQPEQALRICEAMVMARRAPAPLLLERCRALLDLRRAAEALRELQVLLVVDPQRAPPLLELARARHQLGLYNEAYFALERAVDLAPRWRAPVAAMLEVTSRVGSAGVATRLALLARAEASSHAHARWMQPRVLRELAERRLAVPPYDQRDDLAAALERLDEADADEVADARVAIALGAGQMDQGLLLAEQALAGRPTATRHRLRAQALYHKGRVDDALRALDAAIQLRPADGKLRELRGRYLLRAGNPQQALAAFDRALELDSSRGLSAFWRARLRMGSRPPDPLAAAGDFERALRSGIEIAQPSDMLPRLADCYLRSQKQELPLSMTLEALLELQPGNPVARWLRARLRATAGDLDGALRDLGALDAGRLPAEVQREVQSLRRQLEERR